MKHKSESFWKNSAITADNIDPNAPIRLRVAAELAFPDGSMTVSGLRKEARRGRLVIERIAGKDFTSMADIETMREQCRVERKAPEFGSVPNEGTERAIGAQVGSSSTATNTSPRDALRTKLRRRRASSQSI